MSRHNRRERSNAVTVVECVCLKRVPNSSLPLTDHMERPRRFLFGSRLRAWVFLLILGNTAHSVLTAAPPTPRNVLPIGGTTRVVTLEQNWTDDDAQWFYNVPQGSQLIPYKWFLNLEQPDSSKSFS